MSDLIERDKAIEAVLGLHTEHRVYWRDSVVDALKALPSAQPEERTEERTETHACDCISRRDVITSFRLDDDGKAWSMEDIIYRIEQFPSTEEMQQKAQQTSEGTTSDTISRQAAIDIERNATVDTNPSHFEAHQKFTQFMDDAEISSFGRWQWSNGFNTALTAVGIDLKKLPSAQPEPQWIPCSERLPTEGDPVLLCDRYWNMTLGRLIKTDEGYKWDVSAWWNDLDDWNAWIPLPEPWEGEENE